MTPEEQSIFVSAIDSEKVICLGRRSIWFWWL